MDVPGCLCKPEIVSSSRSQASSKDKYFSADSASFLLKDGGFIQPKANIYLTDGKAQVIMEKEGVPVITTNDFGKGKGIYFSSYKHSLVNTRLLLNTILLANNLENQVLPYITDNLIRNAPASRIIKSWLSSITAIKNKPRLSIMKNMKRSQ